MIESNFMVGFASELVLEKNAGHPLFTAVTRGGTLLGRKVRGMVGKTIKRGRVKKYKMKKKAMAGDAVKKVLHEATPGAQARSAEGYGAQVIDRGAEATEYGGGTGNFKGKEAPAFTKKYNPTDMPGAFGKKVAMPMVGQQIANANPRVPQKKETTFGLQGASRAPKSTVTMGKVRRVPSAQRSNVTMGKVRRVATAKDVQKPQVGQQIGQAAPKLPQKTEMSLGPRRSLS